MPYYKALIHIPGGKELKVEKNLVPDELYNVLRSVKEPEIVTVFEGPLNLSDELHKQLQRPKTYSTYIIYAVTFPEGGQSGEAFHKEILFGLHQGNLITPVESVYGYQVLRLEYLYVDDPIPYENRADNPDNAQDNA